MKTPCQSIFRDLEPQLVWSYFETLCSIPRPSKGEAQLVAILRERALALGHQTIVDPVGNLIIRKAASAGCHHWPTVVLQAHLDMVCQSRYPGHDWLANPITPVVDNGWLIADDTTLGADNGIGVSLIMAILEEQNLQHGPIEALLTVDEEAGMGGARSLQPDVLRGSLMLNLDTETWGDFYSGCAGGVDVNVRRTSIPKPILPVQQPWQIELKGLRGGHSGVDIHEARVNAIKLLVDIICELRREWAIDLIELRGGSARNALPRSATAKIACLDSDVTKISASLRAWEDRLRNKLSDNDNGLSITLERLEAATHSMGMLEQNYWLEALSRAPFGVWKMSPTFSEAVETSNNIGVVNLTPLQGTCNFMVRSLRDDETEQLAEHISQIFTDGCADIQFDDHYPAWQPNPDSKLLKRCCGVFEQEFKTPANIRVIHAGLECGVIGGIYPNMDTVSFGPFIRGAHAPGEGVEISSVAQTWQLIKAILASFGRAP